MLELVPETYFAPLDLLAIFGREAPLQVDLGCGDGHLLCELARKHPQRNFLGIEKLAGRVAKVCRKSAHLENVRVLKVESSYAIRHLLPESSVETFYLLFPDPWPKRRQRKRRFVSDENLATLAQVMRSGAELRFATDIDDYAGWTLARILRSPDFVWPTDQSADWTRPWEGWRETRYEKKAREVGRRAVYLTFRASR